MTGRKKTPRGSAKAGTSPWDPVFAPRKPGEKRYWLVKSEPETFSFDDLMASRDRMTKWNGVRNFVARNFMKDGMKLGDEVLFYHSGTNPAVVGIAEVAREAYPDDTAFDRNDDGFDPRSDRADPTWFMVDIRGRKALGKPVALAEIKKRRELAGMAMLRIGRLSVTPVSPDEFAVITAMGR